MDENTKYIVASNLTVAYFAGMKPQLELPSSSDPRIRADEMKQPFIEVMGVYTAFLGSLEERATLGRV